MWLIVSKASKPEMPDLNELAGDAVPGSAPPQVRVRPREATAITPHAPSDQDARGSARPAEPQACDVQARDPEGPARHPPATSAPESLHTPDQPAQFPPSDAPARGVAVIQDHVTRLPGKPGVYRMIAQDGDVLYVGKAKDLKKRVSAYAKSGGHNNRIARMIGLTAAMEFVVTQTETEALLLEANLIKRLKPRFNVVMRDDKSFPYILIRQDHRAAQIQKHRGARSAKGDYFGPFASAWAVNRTLNTLQKAFLLRSCSDSVFDARTRPCMLYQIRRCAGPCVDLVTPDDYQKMVDDAVDFLKGRSNEVQDRLAAQMHAAADALDFERAARLRDRIRALAAISTDQSINSSTLEEADIFAIHQEAGQTCVQVFFFRAFQNWGNRAYFPRHDRDETHGDVLAAFIAQFYDEREPPRMVLTSCEIQDSQLLAEALSVKAERKVEVRCPQRGEKRLVADNALMNAREALGRRLAETSTQARLLEEVARAFDLAHAPQRIEVYDNSHIMGTNAIGAMIVAGPEGFEKSQYRKFNIKSPDVKPGDDYAMMREVLRRRFARLVKDSTPNDEPGAEGGQDFSKADDPVWPDLVMIDGGLGQLNAALAALKDVGLGPQDVNLVAIAKGPVRDAGREQYFQPGRPERRLDEKSPLAYFLQRLRDEAHRFAIGAHRAKRKADIAKSSLDEIDGIGPARKKALLARFGSAKGVARAALADLIAVEGVNEALAQRIFNHFRGLG
jgi:excinuclease ABC subunit C